MELTHNAGKIQNIFYGNYASEEETAEAIRTLYEKTGYISDTHTAVASSVYGKYKAETKDDQTTTVIASTASPFKFSRSVMDAIDPKYNAMEEFELIDELSKIGNVKIPNANEEIPEMHQYVVKQPVKSMRCQGSLKNFLVCNSEI